MTENVESEKQSDRMMDIPNDTIRSKLVKPRCYYQIVGGKKQLNKVGKYQPDSIPPDWTIARNHARAHKVSVQRKVKQDDEVELCLCCGFQIHRKRLKLSTNPEKLSFLGSGYPLYFSFIKSCMIILCLQLLAEGNFNLVTNYQGTDCLTEEQLGNQTTIQQKHLIDQGGFNITLKTVHNICVLDFVTRFTLANKRNDESVCSIQDILAFNSTILTMVYLLFFRRTQKKVDIYCDLEENTPSDYSLLVYNIPRKEGTNYKQELTKYFEEILFKGEQEIVIMKINLGYNMKDVINIQEQRKKLISQKKSVLSSKQPLVLQQIQLTSINNEIENADDSVKQELKMLNKTFHNFAGVAFISFKRESQKRIILENSKISFLEMILNNLFGLQFNEGRVLKYFNNAEIKIIQAPEPQDVNWYQLYNWINNSVWRRFIGSFFGSILFLLLIGLVCYLSIRQAKALNEVYDGQVVQNQTLNEHAVLSHLHALFISLITVLINSLLMDRLVRYIVRFQAFPTMTQQNISIAQKLSVLMFLNSAFTTYIVHSFYTNNIYAPDGLVYTMFYFFLSNCFVPPLIQLSDPEYRYKRLMLRHYKKQKEKCLLTQEEANQLYEYPLHDIASGLSDVLKTVIVAYFYGPLIPMGYLFAIVGLMLYYWAEKYTLFKRKVVKSGPSFQLSSNMTYTLQYGTIIYSFANVIFRYQITDQVPGIAILGAILSLIYNFLPNDKIVDLIWSFREDDEWTDYDDLNFQQDYDRENPVTQREAVEAWINKAHLLSKEKKGIKNKEEVVLEKLSKRQLNYGKLKKQSVELKELVGLHQSASIKHLDQAIIFEDYLQEEKSVKN